MAKVTFDPHSPDDVAFVLKLPTFAAIMAELDQTSTTSAAAEAPTEAPAADGELDIHGMTWNPDIHSTPAKKNADGSWKGKRGKKDDLEAAIAAHKSANTAAAGAAMTAPVTPAPTAPAPSMVAPTPAAPAPTTPAAPIEYGQMATRFAQMVDQDKIEVNSAYSDLAIDYTTLQTNQTDINKFWAYMDALDAGADHAAAVQQALVSVAAG